jgi:hypothetical protein
MAENKIWDDYQFILPARASHFRSMCTTVSIPEDLACRCDWRTCHSWCGILDALSGFRWEILGCTGLLVRCHGILLGSFVLWLRATPHVLWYYLHTSYLPRAWVSMDSNLAAACEVLGVVDELLTNPIKFHVDCSSHLINGCSNWRFVCSSTSAQNCQCSTSPGVFSRYRIYIFRGEEVPLSCLRLTQGITQTSTTRLYRSYVKKTQWTHTSYSRLWVS